MRVTKLLRCAQADNFDGLIYDVPPEPGRKPFGRAANKVRTALLELARRSGPEMVFTIISGPPRLASFSRVDFLL